MLDFRTETFLMVCRLMNYTRAAEALNLTQPAVSQHIRWLENRYHTRLFRYEGKRLTLTEAGQLLKSALTTMQHDERNLQRRMQLAQQGQHILRFGVTPTVGTYLIPAPLARYHRQHPEAVIRMQVDNTARLCRALDEGQLDFAIVEGYFPKRDYDARLYRMERYLPVCAAGYRPDTCLRRMTDLLAHTLIVREEGSGNREIVCRSLSRHNCGLADFAHVIEVSDLHALKALILQGIGVGFLYHAAVKPELTSGALREICLEDFAEEHEITFIWRKNSVFSEGYETLYQLLKP